MEETTKRRGRPKTGNAKTAAQRQREYRIRQKAGLVHHNRYRIQIRRMRLQPQTLRFQWYRPPPAKGS